MGKREIMDCQSTKASTSKIAVSVINTVPRWDLLPCTYQAKSGRRKERINKQ